ncbi:MAG: glycosyltransferase [Pseudomonadota bacterium]
MDLEKIRLNIAMLSVHSSPIGELGTRDTGGMSVCMREIARELGSRGHRVDIYTRLPDPRSQQILDLYENVRLIHLRAGEPGPVDKLAVYPYLEDFFREIEGFRLSRDLCYDLIHSHYWLSARVGDWAQGHWRVPHLVTFHTIGAVKNDTPGVEQEPELRVITERHIAQACDRILAGTETEKTQIIRYYGTSPEKIGVAPCGVNLDLFFPMDKARARQRLGLDHRGALLLYVGRLAPSKGVDRLLEAMGLLRQTHEIRLLIVGGDGHHSPHFQDLKKMCQMSGIEETTVFVGRIEQKDLPTYYSAADLLVVPSRYESFGLVALEALACGTPVMATQVGAMENIIIEGETGHVVVDGSPGSLAEGIEKFMSSANSAPPHSLRKSVERFDWSNVASSILGEYRIVQGSFMEV